MAYRDVFSHTKATMHPSRSLGAALLACAIAVPGSAQQANWQTTWYASPQPTWGSDFILPTNIPASLDDQTVREIVRTSVGGQRVRVHFSNRYGKEPLTIGTVRIARVDATGSRVVTFDGRASATVAPGATIVSDAADFPVAPLTRIAVSTYFPKPTALQTFHWGAQQTAYVSAGQLTSDHPEKLQGRLFLTGVQVDAGPAARTVIAFGDSITDGNGSTPDQDRRWPDALAGRLAGEGVAVINAGISGARLLQDKMGERALARFEQDVLAQPGAKTVIVLIGINDIGWPGSPFAPRDQPVSAAELIAGYQQLIALAHRHRVRIVGATLPPFEGALAGTPFEGHFSSAKDGVRQAVNQWIRHAGAFDGVIDADALLRDPAHPRRLLPVFDSGDHLHPGDAGYRALADAISTRVLFTK
jgi:lysophospholipase L1-like esterase